MFKGQLEMDELGYIKINDRMETNVPGVFAAGEAADPHFRQVVTSAGMGAAAAIQATRYPRGNREITDHVNLKLSLSLVMRINSGASGATVFLSEIGKIKSDEMYFLLNGFRIKF